MLFFSLALILFPLYLKLSALVNYILILWQTAERYLCVYYLFLSIWCREINWILANNELTRCVMNTFSIILWALANALLEQFELIFVLK